MTNAPEPYTASLCQKGEAELVPYLQIYLKSGTEPAAIAEACGWSKLDSVRLEIKADTVLVVKQGAGGVYFKSLKAS